MKSYANQWKSMKNKWRINENQWNDEKKWKSTKITLVYKLRVALHEMQFRIREDGIWTHATGAKRTSYANFPHSARLLEHGGRRLKHCCRIFDEEKRFPQNNLLALKWIEEGFWRRKTFLCPWLVFPSARANWFRWCLEHGSHTWSLAWLIAPWGIWCCFQGTRSMKIEENQ